MPESRNTDWLARRLPMNAILLCIDENGEHRGLPLDPFHIIVDFRLVSAAMAAMSLTSEALTPLARAVRYAIPANPLLRLNTDYMLTSELADIRDEQESPGSTGRRTLRFGPAGIVDDPADAPVAHDPDNGVHVVDLDDDAGILAAFRPRPSNAPANNPVSDADEHVPQAVQRARRGRPRRNPAPEPVMDGAGAESIVSATPNGISNDVSEADIRDAVEVYVDGLSSEGWTREYDAATDAWRIARRTENGAGVGRTEVRYISANQFPPTVMSSRVLVNTPVTRADEPNGNGMVFPRTVMDEAVNRVNEHVARVARERGMAIHEIAPLDAPYNSPAIMTSFLVRSGIAELPNFEDLPVSSVGDLSDVQEDATPEPINGPIESLVADRLNARSGAWYVVESGERVRSRGALVRRVELADEESVTTVAAFDRRDRQIQPTSTFTFTIEGIRFTIIGRGNRAELAEESIVLTPEDLLLIGFTRHPDTFHASGNSTWLYLDDQTRCRLRNPIASTYIDGTDAPFGTARGIVCFAPNGRAVASRLTGNSAEISQYGVGHPYYASLMDRVRAARGQQVAAIEAVSQQISAVVTDGPIDTDSPDLGRVMVPADAIASTWRQAVDTIRNAPDGVNLAGRTPVAPVELIASESEWALLPSARVIGAAMMTEQDAPGNLTRVIQNVYHSRTNEDHFYIPVRRTEDINGPRVDGVPMVRLAQAAQDLMRSERIVFIIRTETFGELIVTTRQLREWVRVRPELIG